MRPTSFAPKVLLRIPVVACRKDHLKEVPAAPDKVVVLVDQVLKAADKVVVLADRVLKAADRAVVLVDRVLKAADRVVVLADRVLKVADKVADRADRVLKAADRVVDLVVRVLKVVDKVADRARKADKVSAVQTWGKIMVADRLLLPLPVCWNQRRQKKSTRATCPIDHVTFASVIRSSSVRPCQTTSRFMTSTRTASR